MVELKTEELVKQYDVILKQRHEKFKENLENKQKELIDIFDYVKSQNSWYHEELSAGLKNGKYNKPSEFINDKMDWLFDGYIYRRHKEALCHAVDNSINCAYSSSYYRRSFRIRDYIVGNVFNIISDFHKEMVFDKDLSDILNLNMNDMEKAYFMKGESWWKEVCSEYAVAYELDMNNEAVMEAVTDIINGDSEVSLRRFILRGIVKSNNVKMHELLGKLLLAARLQEGLRQSICECMDIGTVAAFRELLNVIKENNLIRFSSVKRAIGTWLGLMETDINSLERISNKSIELILECIDNEEKCNEFIQSEDCMEIYIGLWSMAVYDTNRAIDVVTHISKTGTNHQVLTTGYFCANLDNRKLSHTIAKEVIMEHKDEQNILAVYMPYFMREEPYWYGQKRKESGLKDYFDNNEEAERYYELLIEICNAIPGKSIDFSPCIFPWYSASLIKSSVIENICKITDMLDDNSKRDFVCGLLKECNADDRSRCVRKVLDNPTTQLQKYTITTFLCDKESYTRKAAADIVGRMDIEDSNYLQMEEMLKYKAADMRASIINLLCKQSDEKILSTINRLLNDKKEEKRTAGLDIVMQILKGITEKESDKDENKDNVKKIRDKKTIGEAVSYVKAMENPTDKENILIENIFAMASPKDEVQKKALYDESQKYSPKLADSKIYEEAVKVFLKYFPDSQIGNNIKETKINEKTIDEKDCQSVIVAKEDCNNLLKLFLEHVNDEFKNFEGEVCTFGGARYFREFFDDDNNTSGSNNIYRANRKNDIPGMSIWKKWFKENIVKPERLIRMYISLKACAKGLDFDDEIRPYISIIYGKGFEVFEEYEFKAKICIIVERLMEEYIDGETMKMLSIALGYWYIVCLPQEKVLITAIPRKDRMHYCYEREAHFISHSQICKLFSGIKCKKDSTFKDVFPLAVMLSNKTFEREVKRAENAPSYYWNSHKRDIVRPREYDSYGGTYNDYFHEPNVIDYIFAAYYGIISKDEMYEYLLSSANISKSLEEITLLVSGIRERGRLVAKRGGYGWWGNNRKEQLMKIFLEYDDDKICDFLDEIYEEVVNEVLSVELRRGDSETIYSACTHSIKRIYGIDNFIAILTAMGKDTFDRTSYHTTNSKKVNMSYLLGVCIPKDGENADTLRLALSKTKIDEKRLIEAALYSPEWIDIVNYYLGYEGFVSTCYYFMAHMNESFDDKRKAIIAKYTPLSVDELNDGAFDIEWFKNAYSTMGEKRFNAIYNAAKYISDGAKHSRARKYADATLGKMDVDDVETKISDKRNKDLVMAYSLIPLNGEDDVIRRYLFLQQFLKESKKFGAQRIASEKKSVEISLSNLATNAGYSDVTRLTLRMETKLIDDMKELFEDKTIEDVTLRLSVDEDGKAEIICEKADKRLKSIPAKLKKKEYVVKINEAKKKLTQQYTRTKNMFEQAMEDQTAFTVEEIRILHSNPVANAIVRNLVFMSGNSIGFLGEDGQLKDYQGNGKELKNDDNVIVAHPFHIYNDGHWGEYQRVLFEKQIKQPFKQVFRELYVKTEEELDLNYSRRYSGHQIQPQKTVACLKGRRWVADIEDGLQKIYYKENIIARIYAMADWFTPSDIEAPTLEWVEFSDRATEKQLKIKDIPDVIFSEVMRDVDMAVSVAHVGGVDPQTSHSTVEMRAALLKFTLPLFKLDNVEITKNHAIVKGSYGTYDINLGSGIIHKQGGAMINVIAVHSQHRGKIFLPFADDDPKTAEILTKVIMFAEDKKIKDVSILEQIR
ncbi:MAG: DUF4132 domain-containing protein [Lachnospiraceae bacterium]|nr:DUF4132 domain-containing protein [Lachnospiraceae bacterium]